MLSTANLPSIDDIRAELAKRSLLDFVAYHWREKHPFIVGRHTAETAQRIDQAMADYQQGRSTYLIVKWPFRHGKSDLTSRHLPAWFLGEYPDAEVIVASYAAGLVKDFSRRNRTLIRTDRYRRQYPEIELASDSAAVNRWQIQDHRGGLAAFGIGAGIAGHGYGLGIVDDFHANRQEAESEAARQHNWDWFTNDFLTRAAPVSITLLVATHWHLDDLIGRTLRAMDDDPEFPRFEVLSFPAESADYPSGYLFPERFSPDWYHRQRAALGTYGWASLMQQDPVPRGGSLLQTDAVQIVDPADVPESLRPIRGIDLASTAKQRQKDDPDYTVALLVAVKWQATKGDDEPLPLLWILDMRRGQWAAPARDRVLDAAIGSDGPRVHVAVEGVAGYKDTAESIKARWMGKRRVVQISPHTDLVARASALEPAFEAGNVRMLRADWNNDCLAELKDFPQGGHDDIVAALLAAYEHAVDRRKRQMRVW